MSDDNAFIDRLHAALDDEIAANPSDLFLSDWNGTHPFTAEYLGDPEQYAVTPDARYAWFDQSTKILPAIQSFHESMDGRAPSADQVVHSSGSSALIAAVALWCQERRLSEVYYVPPLYYTFHYFFRLLGIQTRPVSGKHLAEPRAALRLPERECVLLLTDPIWYAGVAISHSFITDIAVWQRRTHSLIIVDGSFQYMTWERVRHEFTAELDPDLTIRLLCPTKAVAIPSFRYAYAITPRFAHREFRWLVESISGSTSPPNVRFAEHVMTVLGSANTNFALTDFLQATYQRLLAGGVIETSMEPGCAYFVFALPRDLPAGLSVRTMDQRYFEQKRYPGYVRINLFVAAQELVPLLK